MQLAKNQGARSTRTEWLGRMFRAALLLIRTTVEVIRRYRLTGLAGEAAFFTLTSLPPLLFGLVGALGYLANVIGKDTVGAARDALAHVTGTVLSPQGNDQLVQPMLDEVLGSGQAGVVSIGFVLALWSGSAAVNVFVDTISLVYELAQQRGLIRQRLLSLWLYTLGLFSGVVLLPLLAIGPGWLAQLAPEASVLIHLLYWPSIGIGSIVALTTVYTLSVPLRTPWREHLPGAVVALVLWLLGSAGLRLYLTIILQRSPVYGFLAAPMGLLFWLYITAFAVLIGAAMNSGLDSIMPSRSTARERAKLAV